MSKSAAISCSVQPDTAAPQWLALSLTPAMGSDRGHWLVEDFGGVDRIFPASLTALEAAGLPAVSAQSIAPEMSYSCAEEEFMKARDVSPEIILFEDTRYPARLKKIYDPPLALYVGDDVAVLSQPGWGWSARVIHAVWHGIFAIAGDVTNRNSRGP